MNLEPFFETHWIIQTHVLAATAAVILGAVLLVAPKGTLPHRGLGWTFAGLIVAVAITAVGIAWLKDWRFSWIHGFVPLALFTVVTGVMRARRHDVARHRGAMRGLFFGALVIPGVLAFAPGRLMHVMVFG